MRLAGGWVRGAGLGVVALILGAVRPVVGQALGNVMLPATNPNANMFVPPAGLPSGYELTIRSDWNRPGIAQACAVQGGETIAGHLTWTGASYVGVLQRDSRYAECGMHGNEACTVEVTGSGEVQVAGEVHREDGEPTLFLRWSPARETRVTVAGGCASSYREALARLYRTVTHVVVMPLPRAGAPAMVVALEDQPWVVSVSP